jgi:hypothetical protein
MIHTIKEHLTKSKIKMVEAKVLKLMNLQQVVMEVTKGAK